jgi:hypothetical protein
MFTSCLELYNSGDWQPKGQLTTEMVWKKSALNILFILLFKCIINVQKCAQNEFVASIWDSSWVGVLAQLDVFQSNTDIKRISAQNNL